MLRIYFHEGSLIVINSTVYATAERCKVTTLRNLNYGDLTLGKDRLIREKTSLRLTHWKFKFKFSDIDP